MIDIEKLKSKPISTYSYKLKDEAIGPEMVVMDPTSRISIENAYFNASLKGAYKNIYLRLNVKKKLENILDILPETFSFRIYDGFRTLETQKAIFNEFFEKIHAEGGTTKEESFKKTLLFVPYPGEPGCYDVMPHNSGGAVDLTLLYNGFPLDMGTEFDDTSDLAKTTFFESEFDERHGVSKDRWLQIRANRRLLFNLMVEQGFTNHPFEWWHYNFGNHPWAEELNTKWIYDSAEEKVLKIEKSLS